MTHELSKLNWIDGNDTPDRSEVVGKSLVVQTKGKALAAFSRWGENDYEIWFLDTYDPVLRYAIIDTSEPEVEGKMKTFCPNCEKETDCVHEAELYACNECGEDFAKYIVSRKPANNDVSTTQNVLTDIKTPNSIENSSKEAENRNTNPDYYNRPSESDSSETQLEDTNRKLRTELHTLRFKESEEQRFIWWIWNVYSRNVQDLILDIMGATTYDTEGEAKEGKCAFPKRCFDLMKRVDEYTEKIYNGTYLDVEISTVVKRDLSDAEIEELGAQKAENEAA